MKFTIGEPPRNEPMLTARGREQTATAGRFKAFTILVSPTGPRKAESASSIQRDDALRIGKASTTITAAR